MKDIVIASKNKDKIREIKQIFSEFNIISIYDIECSDILSFEVEEDGKTFYENAVKKAEALSKLLNGKMCIADDSGLEIDSLSGFPGVSTKRWMEGTDRDRNLGIISKLTGLEKEKRKANFTVAVAISFEGKTIFDVEKISGYISDSPRGTNGFGFDEIFELENGKTLASLTQEEKNKISARKIALEKLKEKLITIL